MATVLVSIFGRFLFFLFFWLIEAGLSLLGRGCPISFVTAIKLEEPILFQSIDANILTVELLRIQSNYDLKVHHRLQEWHKLHQNESTQPFNDKA